MSRSSQQTVVPADQRDQVARRFWKLVDAQPLGCWPWTGYSRRGYGVFRLNNRHVPAHRVAFALAKGAVPEGCEVHHRCEDGLCVNPDHLEVLLPSDHSKQDHRRSITATNRQKTHCPRGHEYDVTVGGGRWRWCRTCRIEEGRERRAREKASRVSSESTLPRAHRSRSLPDRCAP